MAQTQPENASAEYSETDWDDKHSCWRHVHCGVCYLPFMDPRNPDAPPPLPFWLTECSHVVCNNHLNSDRTCRVCANGEPVEVIPLHRDMPDPMGRWFQNVPAALFDLVGAARFQHQTMANLILFYKSKCTSQRQLIERLRREVETLKNENDQLKQQPGDQNYFDSSGLNQNGKRRRTEGDDGSYSVEDRRYSSPAFGGGQQPSRLTLRPGSSRIEQEQNRSFEGMGSSPRSLKEFAYQPPVKDDRQTPRPLQSMSNPRHEIAPQNIPSTSKQPQFHPPSRPGTHFNAQGNLVNNQVDRTSNFSAGPNLKLGMQQRSSRNPPGTPLPNLTATRSATNHASLLPHQRTPVVPNAPQAVGGSRRFVPPTPRQPGVLQPLLHAGSLQRSVASTPRFPNSMPPPPPPSFNNGSRFRAGNFG